MLNYKGPILWQGSLIHDTNVSDEQIIEILDRVIESVRTEVVDAETIERAKIKWRSSYYDQINRSFGFGRADLLASLALFDDDPTQINRFEAGIMAVTPEMILETAQEYLRPTNRTILVLEAGAAQEAQEVASND